MPPPRTPKSPKSKNEAEEKLDGQAKYRLGSLDAELAEAKVILSNKDKEIAILKKTPVVPGQNRVGPRSPFALAEL